MLSSCEHSYACYASCMMVTYCLDPSLWQFGTLTGADWRSFNAPQQHLRKEMLHLYGNKGPLISRGQLVAASGAIHYWWLLVLLIQVSIGYCICCSLSINICTLSCSGSDILARSASTVSCLCPAQPSPVLPCPALPCPASVLSLPSCPA